MNVAVDAEKCIGCGLCAQVAPGVYEMKEDKAVVVSGIAEDKAEEAKNGAEQCPVAAIDVS